MNEAQHGWREGRLILYRREEGAPWRMYTVSKVNARSAHIIRASGSMSEDATVRLAKVKPDDPCFRWLDNRSVDALLIAALTL